MQIREFLLEKYEQSQPIVIYGAGAYGELCFRCLESAGLKPYAFADRREDVSSYFGIPVIRPDEIRKIQQPCIILATVTYFRAVAQFLAAEGFNKVYTFNDMLKTMGEDAPLSDYARMTLTHENEYGRAIADYKNQELSINNIDLVVTQYCNLRCRDCGSLMPYYKQPRHFDAGSIIESFDRLLSVVSRLEELRILGGETFLYPELTKVIRHYLANEKVQHLYVYTNAAMHVAEETLAELKNAKITVRISDYGKLSKNKDELVDCCTKLGINYEVLSSLQWRDMGGVEKRNYSEKEITTVFQRCENAKCPSFCDGKLYICPRAAHMDKLGVFECLAEEKMDFSTRNSAEQYGAADISDFLFGRPWFTACNYCSGNSGLDGAIPVAIQMERDK